MQQMSDKELGLICLLVGVGVFCGVWWVTDKVFAALKPLVDWLEERHRAKEGDKLVAAVSATPGGAMAWHELTVALDKFNSVMNWKMELYLNK